MGWNLVFQLALQIEGLTQDVHSGSEADRHERKQASPTAMKGLEDVRRLFIVLQRGQR